MAMFGDMTLLVFLSLIAIMIVATFPHFFKEERVGHHAIDLKRPAFPFCGK